MISTNNSTCPNCLSPNQNSKFCTSCGFCLTVVQKSYEEPKAVIKNNGNYTTWVVGGLVIILVLFGFGNFLGNSTSGYSTNTKINIEPTIANQPMSLSNSNLVNNTDSKIINYTQYLKYQITGSGDSITLNGSTCSGLFLDKDTISTVEHCINTANETEPQKLKDRTSEVIRTIDNKKESISAKYLSQEFVFPYKSDELVYPKNDTEKVFYVFTVDKVIKAKADCVNENCTLMIADECKSHDCEIRQGQSGSPVFNSFGQYVGNLSYSINSKKCFSNDTFDYTIYNGDKQIKLSDFASNKSIDNKLLCSNEFAFSVLPRPNKYQQSSKIKEPRADIWVESYHNTDYSYTFLNLKDKPCGNTIGKVLFGETGKLLSEDMLSPELANCNGNASQKWLNVGWNSGKSGWILADYIRTIKNNDDESDKFNFKEKVVYSRDTCYYIDQNGYEIYFKLNKDIYSCKQAKKFKKRLYFYYFNYDPTAKICYAETTYFDTNTRTATTLYSKKFDYSSQDMEDKLGQIKYINNFVDDYVNDDYEKSNEIIAYGFRKNCMKYNSDNDKKEESSSSSTSDPSTTIKHFQNQNPVQPISFLTESYKSSSSSISSYYTQQEPNSNTYYYTPPTNRINSQICVSPCGDGTCSGSSGRGSCSHHGGISGGSTKKRK